MYNIRKEKEVIDINKKHTEMLNILSNKKIFKFKTLISERSSELTTIFKDYNKKEIADFLVKLAREGFLVSNDDFKRRKVEKNNYMAVCIDWRRIIEDKAIDYNSEIYKFFLKYPITFSIVEQKSKYLMNLEYYNFIQPSGLIHSLDSLFIMYFNNRERFKELVGDESNLIIDLYSNLYSYAKTTPILSNNLYDLETYEALFKESNINMDVITKNELYKTVEVLNIRIAAQIDVQIEETGDNYEF